MNMMQESMNKSHHIEVERLHREHVNINELRTSDVEINNKWFTSPDFTRFNIVTTE